MPARKLSTSYVDWSGRDVRFATKDEKALLHRQPFIITDAAIIPTKFGEGAFFLAQACDAEGEHVIGEQIVLAFHADEEKSPSRHKAVEEVREARANGEWVGPLVLFDFETGNDLGNPFITFRNYDPNEMPGELATETPIAKSKGRRKIDSELAPAASETPIDPDEIPF